MLIITTHLSNRFDKRTFKPSITEPLCQDPLENYFDRKRSTSRRRNNSHFRKIGYQDNTLHNSKNFWPIINYLQKL